MKGKSRAVLTAGLGTILSLSIATSAAALTDLDIGSGTLNNKGLTATVPVTFTCDVGSSYQGFVYVRQIAQQRTVTEANTFIFGECTGELQTVYVRMLPSPKPFKKGTALASAFMESGENVVDVEIRLR